MNRIKNSITFCVWCFHFKSFFVPFFYKYTLNIILLLLYKCLRESHNFFRRFNTYLHIWSKIVKNTSIYKYSKKKCSFFLSLFWNCYVDIRYVKANTYMKQCYTLSSKSLFFLQIVLITFFSFCFLFIP